ncbi:MAG: hypothetical protein L0027_06550 [Candidatus Rokubacteria bacterium]|nr:hypothetical protein [Candidatus Rokubacteria bacterium]
MVGGALGFLGGLMPGLQQAGQLIPQAAIAGQLREERRAKQGLDTLAVALKLPANLRGPYLDTLSERMGIDKTLIQTIKRADERQSAAIVDMLSQAGVQNPQGVIGLLQADPGAVLKLYTAAEDRRRQAQKDTRLREILTTEPTAPAPMASAPPAPPQGALAALGGPQGLGGGAVPQFAMPGGPAPLGRPVAPPQGRSPASLGPAAEIGAATGMSLEALNRQVEDTVDRLDALARRAQALQAENLYTETVDKGFSQQRSTLEKRLEGLHKAIDRVTPTAMEPAEEEDPDSGQVHRVLRDKRTGEVIARLGRVPVKIESALGKLEQELARLQRTRPDSPAIATMEAIIASEGAQARLAPEKTRAEIAKAGAETVRVGVETAKTRAEIGQIGAATRKVEADIAEGKQPKPSDVAGMRKEFTGQSKPFVEVRDAFRRVQAASPTAQGDIGLIYGLMKMYDPGSVVREGEFATAQNAAGVPDVLRNMWNRTVSGARLNDQQRGAFKAEAAKLYGAQLRGQRQLEEQYRGIARRGRIDPTDVVIDLVSGGEEAPGAPAAAAPSGAVRVGPIPGLGRPSPAEDLSRLSDEELLRRYRGGR